MALSSTTAKRQHICGDKNGANMVATEAHNLLATVTSVAYFPNEHSVGRDNTIEKFQNTPISQRKKHLRLVLLRLFFLNQAFCKLQVNSGTQLDTFHYKYIPIIFVSSENQKDLPDPSCHHHPFPDLPPSSIPSSPTFYVLCCCC